MTSNSKRRQWLLAALAVAMLVLAGPGLAQPAAPKTAVLSLFGTELQVVTRRMATGSNLVRNDMQALPIAGGVFDRAALTVAEQLLQKLQQPAPVLLTSTSPSLHSQQGRFFDGTLVKLPEAFVKAAREEGATQLVLLTRHRGEAQFRTRDGWVGQGPVEGPGYYIDTVELVKSWQDMEARTGYLAAYAYIRMTLVELATMRVVRENRLQGNRIVLQATGDGSIGPWGALSAEQKVTLLNDVVAQELERELPLLLGLGPTRP